MRPSSAGRQRRHPLPPHPAVFEDSINPSISGNGRFIAFQSRIANFVSADTNDNIDVFVKDLVTGGTSLKSVSPAGVQGDCDSTLASLSFDGQCIAFTSGATNLLSTGSTTGGVFLSFVEPVAASSLADLGALTSKLGTISPGLNPGVASYSASVATAIDTARVKPEPADPAATIAVRINSGEFMPLAANDVASLPLELGPNTIQIKVTAADGQTTQTYSLAVTRGSTNPAASNAALAALVPSAGALTPAFAADVALYTVQVPDTTTTMTLTPSVASPGATVTVNGTAVASGAASGAISLGAGNTTISTIVTAQDGVTTKTYAVAVTRLPNTNANLSNLVPGSGSLAPAFASATTAYTLSVPNATTEISFTPTVAQPQASVTINGEPVPSATASGAIPLNPGSNLITIVVLASTTKTYTVEVTRAAGTLTAIETWRQTHFGSSANAGNGADRFDLDLDGLVNLIEFAFGLNPKVVSGQLPQPQRVGDNLIISFTQPAGVSGITYGAEWSSTLQQGDWHPITDTGTGNQHSFSITIGPELNLFMRLRVTNP